MSQQIASMYAKIGADTADFEKGMASSHKALSSFGTMLGTGLVAAAALGVAAIAGVGLAIGKGISAAADFEQNLANIASTAGMTLEQMGPLKKYLFDLALDPKLKVNLDEASAAAANLVKNGLTLDQVTSGAARSVVLLANATGADFGAAADTVTNVMQMFNIEAGKMDAAVSNIAGTQQASKMTAQDYAGFIAQAGGVAAAAGVELEDFNATGAATAYMFSSGTDAGTSFKTFMQRLIPVSVAATDEMKKLGLITEDGKNKFYDANGAFLGMENAAGLLKTAMGGLTEEQKNASSAIMFGTDASRTAFALMEQGTEGIKKYKETIGNVSAEDAAATRMDTLSGQWEIFRGTVDAASVMIGDAFLPAMKEIVKWLQATSDKYMPDVIAWFGRFAAWITESLPKIEAFIVKLGGWAQAFLDWATGSGESLNIVSTAATWMGAKVTEAFGALVSWVQANLPKWVATLKEWGVAAGAWIVDVGWPLLLVNLQKWSANLWAWIVAEYPKWFAYLKQWGTAAGDWVMVTGWPALISNLTKWGEGLLRWLVAQLPSFIKTLAEWAVQLAAWVIQGTAMMIDEMAKGANALRVWLKGTGRDNVESSIFSWVGPMYTWVMEKLWPMLKPALGMLFDAVVNIIGASASVIWEAFWALFRAIPQKILDGLANAFKEKWANFASWWVGGWTDFVGLVSDIWGIAKNWAQAVIDGFKQGFIDRWEGFKQWWRDAWQNITEIPQNILQMHSPSVVFYDMGANVMQGFSNGIIDTMPIVERTMNTMASKVTKIAVGMYDQMNAAVKNAIDRTHQLSVEAGSQANIQAQRQAEWAAYQALTTTGNGTGNTYGDLSANQNAAMQLSGYSLQDQSRAQSFLTAMQDPKYAADVGQQFHMTIGEINVGGTGNSAQDILSALRFLTTTYYSYGY
jgi:TP901 family phage tail tape measure protein